MPRGIPHRPRYLACRVQPRTTLAVYSVALSTMGHISTDTEEHLLLVFYKDLPEQLLERIRRQFPEAKVTAYWTKGGGPVPRGW